MRIGNLPGSAQLLVEGKRYWVLSIGRKAISYLHFEGGWRAFEFIIYKPHHDLYEAGKMLAYSFRLAFAYWLPFYPL